MLDDGLNMDTLNLTPFSLHHVYELSDEFNSGVMVIKPTPFNNVLAKTLKHLSEIEVDIEWIEMK